MSDTRFITMHGVGPNVRGALVLNIAEIEHVEFYVEHRVEDFVANDINADLTIEIWGGFGMRNETIYGFLGEIEGTAEEAEAEAQARGPGLFRMLVEESWSWRR